MRVFAAVSLDTDELRIELLVAQFLVRAKLMRVLQTSIFLLFAYIGALRLTLYFILGLWAIREKSSPLV